ncbi:hypothetical protein AK37_16510 [Rhodococcus pyridinivorans AK37]|uniref:Uncharacterized protein n=1 Tax=Rhodococcus pyridinivorans AK37 TaxID=1114960 RepID=H0JUC8_9NOCA|nr:hypothetical protein AK37_16510 [Rhodococcus pyridinivorans AK37]
MGEPTYDGIARDSLAATASTPPAGFDDAAREHRPFGFESLTGDFEPELVHANEGSQIGRPEARIRLRYLTVRVLRRGYRCHR